MVPLHYIQDTYVLTNAKIFRFPSISIMHCAIIYAGDLRRFSNRGFYNRQPYLSTDE
jgi:hypothetical protein